MGKLEDALVAIRWLPTGWFGGPPIPFRKQGYPPEVTFEELVEEARGMVR